MKRLSITFPLALLLSGSPAMAWTWPWKQKEQKQHNPQADCALWKVRSNASYSASQIQDKYAKKALDYYLLLKASEGKEIADKWWNNPDVSVTDKGPDSHLAWMNWATEKELKADQDRNKIGRLMLERYFPYSKKEVQRMWDYRLEFGSKFKAWYSLKEDHPDRKKGIPWLLEQGMNDKYPEIWKFCKELTGES